MESIENISAIKKEVIKLFKETFGLEPVVNTLSADGSPRLYYRLISPELDINVIGTYNENIRENRAFVSLANSFGKAGYGVPKIYSFSGDERCYLQEDLGDSLMLPLLEGEKRLILAEKALTRLAELQTSEENLWEDNVMEEEYGYRQIKWDLNYFKYSFIKPSGFIFDEEKLEKDFDKLANNIGEIDENLKGFMYRDFQSRNLMIKDGEIRFIDFQGGRKGPILYDAISFVCQAKAGFSNEERNYLLNKYAQRINEIRNIKTSSLLKDKNSIILIRLLQTLGAYGFRGLIERKGAFITSLPKALSNLKELIEGGALKEYPELEVVCKQAVESRFAQTEKHSGLKINICSFSFRKGYPEDLSGNGGGFVFDCRFLPNPGRFERYKQFTGKDIEVIEFFKDKPEIDNFLRQIEEMLKPAIKNYLERKFENLQVSFGCTGGQHRSVYCAEQTAKRLKDIFPEISVNVSHREQK